MQPICTITYLACIVSFSSDKLTRLPGGGHCKRYLPRYYCSRRSKQCKRIMLHRCGSLRYTFSTFSQCQRKCMHSKVAWNSLVYCVDMLYTIMYNRNDIILHNTSEKEFVVLECISFVLSLPLLAIHPRNSKMSSERSDIHRLCQTLQGHM